MLLLVPLLAHCASVNQSLLQSFSSDQLHDNEHLIRTGHYREAADELSMLLEMDENNEQALFLRGVANQYLEQYSFAVRDYSRVTELNPKFILAYYNLGMIEAFILNDRALAKKAFEQFLALAPNHPEAFGVSKILSSL